MSYLPCRNPNCRSYGKPHPNCKCGPEMAEGGEVEPFCGQSSDHKSDCEYFSQGGTIGHFDPQHAVAGHLAHGGLVGLLKMDKDRDLEKYDRTVNRGHKSLNDHLDIVFSGGKHPPSEDRSKHHKYIEDWIDGGGITQALHEERHIQHLAGGGEVKPHERVLNDHPVQNAYPDHNIALQAAKGRASNYLNALKPQENLQKLPFDDEPDQKDKKKAYKSAVKIADSPLSVLREISHGTVDVDHILHLKTMYPEMHDAIQKKITEKIIDSQLKGKKPSAKIRQAMSLMMGVPLSGELTPAGIQAAQATFANKRQGQQQEDPGSQTGKAKKSTTPLSKSDDAFLTGGQTLVKRQQRV